MTQYGQNNKPTSQQYYYARKRSDETPLAYLYRLDVAAIREKISIREGTPVMRREHTNHIIKNSGRPRLGQAVDFVTMNEF